MCNFLKEQTYDKKTSSIKRRNVPQSIFLLLFFCCFFFFFFEGGGGGYMPVRTVASQCEFKNKSRNSVLYTQDGAFYCFLCISFTR